MPSGRIRVCQLTPCLWSGGTEERIARVLAAMDRREFEISWMGFGPLREALVERAGPRVRAIPIARNVAGGVEPTLIPKIAAQIRRLRPDIMHIHNWSTSLYGIAAARLAGVPCVVFGLGGQDTPDPPPRRRRAVMRALAPHVDRFTAVCEFLGGEIAVNWAVPRSKIAVLSTGIDLAPIDSAPDKARVRADLGIPDDAFVLGAISVFRPVKRIPDLIDAAGLLAREHPNIRLLLVGNPVGVSPEDLRARAAAKGLEGRFHLLGRVERPAWILPAFDLFVNCSSFEGASNAILEAMAARIPVVATRVGGTPELVEHEVHGLLVPPEDVGALSAALRRMIEDEPLRRACGNRGRERVEARHTHAMMISAYLDFYRRLHREGLRGGSRTRMRTLVDLAASLRQVADRPA